EHHGRISRRFKCPHERRCNGNTPDVQKEELRQRLPVKRSSRPCVVDGSLPKKLKRSNRLNKFFVRSGPELLRYSVERDCADEIVAQSEAYRKMIFFAACRRKTHEIAASHQRNPLVQQSNNE